MRYGVRHTFEYMHAYSVSYDIPMIRRSGVWTSELGVHVLATRPCTARLLSPYSEYLVLRTE
jgi:hypothetical protein